jgi:hypothetical protein
MLLEPSIAALNSAKARALVLDLGITDRGMRKLLIEIISRDVFYQALEKIQSERSNEISYALVADITRNYDQDTSNNLRAFVNGLLGKEDYLSPPTRSDLNCRKPNYHQIQQSGNDQQKDRSWELFAVATGSTFVLFLALWIVTNIYSVQQPGPYNPRRDQDAPGSVEEGLSAPVNPLSIPVTEHTKP